MISYSIKKKESLLRDITTLHMTPNIFPGNVYTTFTSALTVCILGIHLEVNLRVTLFKHKSVARDVINIQTWRI